MHRDTDAAQGTSAMRTGPNVETLFDLNAQGDAEWQEFLKIPSPEVRTYWKEGQPAGRVQESFDRMKAIRERIEAHPDTRDFEADLRKALGPQMAADDALATEVWSAMTNSTWTHEKGDRYGASFRSAGGTVAEIRNAERGIDDEAEGAEHYMTWYCSGPYAVCSERVAEALAPFGWTWCSDEEDR
jgi:hypothetical protein